MLISKINLDVSSLHWINKLCENKNDTYTTPEANTDTLQRIGTTDGFQSFTVPCMLYIGIGIKPAWSVDIGAEKNWGIAVIAWAAPAGPMYDKLADDWAA